MNKIYKVDFIKIGLILIILSSVPSCGQKGPLYYPDKDNAFLSDHQNIT